MLRRLLPLAGAAAPALGLWHQLVRRPLPRTSGTLHVRGPQARVRVERDRRGVIRVDARSETDLCFGEGFAVGQERLFQLDFMRRAGSGRLAEVVGPEALPIDRMFRTLGLRRAAERHLERLDERGLALLEAYSAGVSAAIDAMSAPPLELQLLRAEPEPWRPVDTLTIGGIVALGFSTNMEAELLRAELVKAVGPERAARLEARDPHGTPVVVTPGEPWAGDALALADQLATVRALVGFGPEPAGSNNWAVAAHRSATGTALLANDPHITTSIPDVWLAVELHAPGIDLRGGTLPAYPGIVIGQSPHVAWGFTNVMSDVQDLYVERVREPSNGGPPEYLTPDGWRPLTVRVEEVRVRGRAEPELLELRETHHGPLVSDALRTAAAGDEQRLVSEPLALAWTALREPSWTPVGIDVAHCRSGRELAECFGGYFVPPMNLVWADAAGEIGYRLVGLLPRRRGGCPDLPKPGWTGEHEWDGYVPFDELPELVNPADGVVVTANNRVAPADYPHHITSEYQPGYRAERIAQLLAERERHTLDDLARIQLDVHSIPGAETARRLARLTPRDERQRDALDRLARWDHRLDADSVAATIYAAFTVELARLVSEAAIGDPALAARWRSRSMLGFTTMDASPWRFQPRLLELWEEADPELVGGRSWDELALDALGAALAVLRRDHGEDPQAWRWGRVHGVKLQHPLGEGGGAVSRALDRLLSRRLPAGGGPESVNCVGYVAHGGDFTGSWAATFRLLCDAGDPARARWQHMTGQSGHLGSRHYDDLLEGWLAGRSHPFGQPAVAALELVPA